MKNLPTFEQFLNEAKEYDFSDLKKYRSINPKDSGVVRKSPSYTLKQGNYNDTRFGKAEIKKLIDYLYSGIHKKYHDAELSANDEPHSMFTQKIKFNDNILRFGEDHMNTEKAPDFKKILQKVKNHVYYSHWSIEPIDSAINIRYADLDRLAKFIIDSL